MGFKIWPSALGSVVTLTIAASALKAFFLGLTIATEKLMEATFKKFKAKDRGFNDFEDFLASIMFFGYGALKITVTGNAKITLCPHNSEYNQLENNLDVSLRGHTGIFLMMVATKNLWDNNGIASVFRGIHSYSMVSVPIRGGANLDMQIGGGLTVSGQLQHSVVTAPIGIQTSIGHFVVPARFKLFKDEEKYGFSETIRPRSTD